MIQIIISIVLLDFGPVERIVAIVDDTPILHSEVVELMGGEYAESTDAVSRSYSEALEELIENRLIISAAVDAGLYPTEAEIAELVEEQLETDPGLAGTDRDLLETVLAEDRAAQIFMGRRIQAALQDMPVSSEAYLQSNSGLLDELVMPRRLSWIYLPVLPSGPDYDVAAAELSEIRDRIEAGESFEDMALAYSDDNSAVNGGYLGSFQPGEMTYTFENALSDLQPGEISQPVATPFGVHLIRLDARNDDGTLEASHILRLVSVDDEDVEAAMEEARRIKDRIDGGEMDFNEAAALYSVDRSTASMGGDIGVRPIRMWMPEAEDALCGLSTGECSSPILSVSAGAVLLVKMAGEDGESDLLETFSNDELDILAQQVVYQRTFETMVDSLRREIPVIYLTEDDGSGAD